MNKYLLSIRIKGQIVKTTMEADSAIHAKLLGEWHYGIGSVPYTPIQLEEVATPQTPQQARIKSLQTQKDNLNKQLKAERDRQRIAKAQSIIANTKRNL